MSTKLTFAQQALGLRSRFPDARIDLGRTRLVLVADLTPSPLSRTYSIQIEYDDNHAPAVKVLSPALEGPPTQELPHTYEDDVLCLYLPGEWNASDLITLTIVPWTVEWLLPLRTLASNGRGLVRRRARTLHLRDREWVSAVCRAPTTPCVHITLRLFVSGVRALVRGRCTVVGACRILFNA